MNTKQRPFKGIGDVDILDCFFLSFQDADGTKRVKVRKSDHKSKLTKQHHPGPMLISRMVCQQIQVTLRTSGCFWSSSVYSVLLGCRRGPAAATALRQRATGKGKLSHTPNTRGRLWGLLTGDLPVPPVLELLAPPAQAPTGRPSALALQCP